MKRRTILLSSMLLFGLMQIILFANLMVTPALAQTEQTTRYTIQKGDTLWNISAKFLDNPWRWSELWEQNPHLHNPNLIYPGDVLLISDASIRVIRNTRLRTEKLSPKVRSTPLNQAITTIEPSAIMPFLSQSIIVDDNELEQAAYVLEGVNQEIILGKYSRFYASGIPSTPHTQFQIFRIGRPIIDPTSKLRLGIEGVHLGTATLLTRHGEVTTLEVQHANQEIRPGDRLVAIDSPPALPHYFPHKPATHIDTRILMIPKGVNEAGRRDVVILSGGYADQLEAGHVLEVFSDSGQTKDPVSKKMITLPDLKIATAMIFKTYAKLSYATLMETSGPVKMGDRASSP